MCGIFVYGTYMPILCDEDIVGACAVAHTRKNVPCHMVDISDFICGTYMDIHQTYECQTYRIRV